MKRSSLAQIAGLLALYCAPTSVHAVTTCTVSATSVAFGVYNPASATPTDSTGTITLSCTASGFTVLPAININGNAGGAGGNVSNRRMVSGANTLSYQLYTNAVRNILWGDGTNGGFSISTSLSFTNSGSVSATVYGRIPALQSALPGNYADTITVTVNY